MCEGGEAPGVGGNESSESVQLPRHEWERVLTGLAVYANVTEYRKDNPEKASSVRTTARGIARQLSTDS